MPPPRSPRRGRRPTLATLAEDLGISRATVSNAYNRPDQLSAELRERILGRARELGYAGPHPAARALNSRTLSTVGIVFSERLGYPFADPATRQVLLGLSEVADEEQLGLLLLPAPAASTGDRVRTAMQRAVIDALVVYSMPDDDPTLRAAVELGVPTVVVDQPRPGAGSIGHVELGPTAGPVGFVGIDDHAAGRRAVDHLLGLGHTRIAVATYRLARDGVGGQAGSGRQRGSMYQNVRDRLAGVRSGLEAAGLDPSGLLVVEAPENTRSDGAAAGRTIWDAHPRPTGVVALSDELAVGVLDAARLQGLQVPSDASVIGFDDSETAREHELTTISQPLADKGRVVARRLVEAFQGDAAPADDLLPVRLVARATTGRPA